MFNKADTFLIKKLGGSFTSLNGYQYLRYILALETEPFLEFKDYINVLSHKFNDDYRCIERNFRYFLEKLGSELSTTNFINTMIVEYEIYCKCSEYVYVVQTAYYDFEDYDMNYCEVNGVFKELDSAINILKIKLEDEFNLEMVFENKEDEIVDIKSLLDNRGGVYLKQANGNGKADLRIDRMELL